MARVELEFWTDKVDTRVGYDLFFGRRRCSDDNYMA